MANPYDTQYTVQESDGVLKYKGVCYQPGDVISLKSTEKYCFFDEIFPQTNDACFPEYCEDGGDYAGFRVPFEIPDGGVSITDIPSLAGCCAPTKAVFSHCGECIYLGIDADPITDPSDPLAQQGGGGYANPKLICLSAGQSTLHLAGEPGTTGMISFYR